MDTHSETDQLTRRDFLRISGITALGILAHPFLAACSSVPLPVQASAEQRLQAAKELERQKFAAEVDSLIPSENDIADSIWHNDANIANLSVSPPAAKQGEYLQEPDIDNKIREILRYCALYVRKPDRTIVSPPRWSRNDVTLCNLYAQAVAQLMTYKIGTGDPVKVSSTVDSRSGKPLYFGTIAELSDFRTKNPSRLEFLDAPKMQAWFAKYGKVYGWKEMKDETALEKALNDKQIIYGVKTYQDTSLYNSSHNWILCNYWSRSLNRMCRVVTQATRHVFLEREEDVKDMDPNSLYKYDPFKFPPKEAGGPRVTLWTHKVT